jgi:predicted ATPase/signal transduction histidine kinase
MHCIPGYQITEVLHTGSKTLIYRAVREKDACPVIIKTLVDDYPNPQDLACLQHEYALTKDWQDEGLLRSYELIKHQHTQLLIQQDIKGISLNRLLAERPLSLESFLLISLALAHALSHIHRRMLIHKDINPSNLVINLKTRQVQIIDFGLATQLSRETPQLQAPGLLEGTLAYLSPEQTGRMNRDLDYRTDFYSLGASFYEMLTGVPPFSAADPMELVHCHLAKMPRPPHELCPELPPVLSDIVLKLMAKTAEQRYQSGFGLCADLSNCLQQFRLVERGLAASIDSFELGQQDVSERFQISQKLYGRESQVQQVLDTFARVSQGQTDMLLVAGDSGIGKTALVHEVIKPISQKNGYFIEGKFDQFQRGTPYAAMIQAFQKLIHQLLTESPARIRHWKTRIEQALGANAQVVIDVIPEVALILGPQPAVDTLPPQDARNRFQTSAYLFIEVFAQPEHPLVLFLDDLQWADFASLQLLETLLGGFRHPALLILGAYRDNEVDATHPFMLALDGLRKIRADLCTLKLQALGFDDLHALVCDTLTPSECDVSSLAEVILHKTGGNPFFVNAFLTRLYEQGELSFSARDGGWQWDMAHIKAQKITDNVVELMAQKMRTLPLLTQQSLVLAACIGHQFDLTTLAQVDGSGLDGPAVATPHVDSIAGGGRTVFAIMRELWAAVKAGLLLAQGNWRIEEVMLASDTSASMASYRFHFAHDRVQQAAYELKPAAYTAALHLKIGRLWLKQLGQAGPQVAAESSQMDDTLFAVTNQFHAAFALIQERAERVQVAQLNLQAGKKAIASTAFSSAMRYLNSGLALLGGGDWENQYALTLELMLVQAECEYINHQHALAEQHFNVALQHAKTNLEKAGIHMRQMELFGSQGAYQRAVDEGLAGLRLLGIKLPAQAKKYHILLELLQENWHRRGLPVKLALDRLPLSQSPTHQLAIRIFSLLAPFASFVNLPLTALMSVRAVNLVYRRGIAPDAAYMLMTFSATLLPIRRYELAQAYADKANQLCQMQAVSSQLIPLHMFANWINHWYHPLHTSIIHLEHCLKLALETGNWIYASFVMCNQLHAFYGTGLELSGFLRQSEKIGHLFQQMGNPNRLGSFCRWSIAWVQALVGGEQQAQAQAGLAAVLEESVMGTPNHAVHYFIHTFACFYQYLFEDFQQAAFYLKKARKNRLDVVGMQISTDYVFLNILITLAQKTAATPPEPRVMQVLQKEIGKLAGWAAQCPQNFAHKHLLAAAEIARVEGRRSQAQDLYDEAIDAAQKNGFIHHQAVAAECAARFYLEHKKTRIAQVYLGQAHHLYAKWGALAKVKQLEEKYPNLRANLAKNNSLNMSASNASHDSPLALPMLDFATVLKATHAISGEIVLGNLLKKLIHLLMENAGAQHGVLLLETDGEWRIEAEGNVNQDGISVNVLQSQALVPPLRVDSAAAHASERDAAAAADRAAAEADRADAADAANMADLAGPPPTLPNSLIQYVIRSKEPFSLNHASAKGRFKHNPYIRQNQIKSVLCAPILHQGKMAGVLYLENNLMEAAFTVDRLGILMVFSSQAAISIENARVYENLESTVAQRTAALLESSTALAKAYKAAEAARQHAESAEQQANQALSDLRLTQSQLVQSEKMAALGHLVAGVAHELNTPIGNVLVTATLLRDRSRDLKDSLDKGELRKSTVTEFVNDATMMSSMIDNSCQRAATLINIFKQVAVDQTSEQRRPFSLNGLLEDSIAALRASLKPGPWLIEIDITDKIDCDSYPGPLGQVILNLVNNAWTHAFAGRAAGVLKISAMMNPPNPAKPLAQSVKMVFEDDGNGMDETILAHIFEPFYTGEQGHGGPGLGLSISLNIVTGVLGGTLSASSVPGSGSRFEIIFPLTAPGR